MSSIEFLMPALDLSIDASSATMFTTNSYELGGYNAVADVNIPKTTLSPLFQFWTDASDVTDIPSADLLFKFNNNTSTAWGIDLDTNVIMGSGTGTFDASNAGISGPILASSSGLNNYLTYDYVRYLAKKLFNTPNGTDLFNNETTLRSNLQSDFLNTFNANISAKDATALQYVVDGAGGTKSVSQCIFDQILISGKKSRFSDLMTLSTSIPNWYLMPIQPGDSLSFLLTVAADPDQNDLTSVGDISQRVYKINLHITDS